MSGQHGRARRTAPRRGLPAPGEPRNVQQKRDRQPPATTCGRHRRLEREQTEPPRAHEAAARQHDTGAGLGIGDVSSHRRRAGWHRRATALRDRNAAVAAAVQRPGTSPARRTGAGDRRGHRLSCSTHGEASPASPLPCGQGVIHQLIDGLVEIAGHRHADLQASRFSPPVIEPPADQLDPVISRVVAIRPHYGSEGEVRRRLKCLAEGTGGDSAHQSAGRAPARNPL